MPDYGQPITPIFGGGLAGYEPAYAEAALKYGIDPNLLMSISMFETGNGTSHMLAKQNNVGGLADPKGGYRSFDSIPESIDFMAKNLKNNYIDKGLTTIPQIAAKYAPVGASNDPNQTNNEWPAAVGNFYSQLSGGGSSPSRGAMIAPTPVTGGAYADSGQPYDMMGGQYANFSGGTPGAATGTGTTQAIGGALASILQNLGKSQSQGTGLNPQSLMGPVKPLAWYAPAPFPQLPYT